jgi:hypothetical protein
MRPGIHIGSRDKKIGRNCTKKQKKAGRLMKKRFVMLLAVLLAGFIFGHPSWSEEKLSSRVISNREPIKIVSGRITRLIFPENIKEAYGAGVSQQNNEIDVISHGNILEVALNVVAVPSFDLTIIMESGSKYFIPVLVAADEFSRDSIVYVTKDDSYSYTEKAAKPKAPSRSRSKIDVDFLLAVSQGVIPRYMHDIRFYDQNKLLRKDNLVEVYIKRLAVYGKWKCYEVACKNISNQKVNIDWTKLVFKGSVLNWCPYMPEQPILPLETVPMYFIVYQ